MGDEAKSLASEARRSRSERDADRLCRTESLPLIPTIKAWWWDSEKRQKLLQHIKKFPRSVDTERGNGGRPQAVSSGASPAAELPLWSQLIRACPIPLGRLKLIRLKANLSILQISPPVHPFSPEIGYNIACGVNMPLKLKNQGEEHGNKAHCGKL